MKLTVLEMLQNEIMKIEEYFRGIEYFNKAVIVKVNFPDKWQVFPSQDGKIKPAKSEDGCYYYYGNSEEVTLDGIFDLINNTISSNKYAEQKIEFLLAKRKELDDLFRNTPFEKLKTLVFEFKPQKKKRKSKPKEEVKTESAVEEVNNVNNEPQTEEAVEIKEEPKKRSKKKKEGVENDGDS